MEFGSQLPHVRVPPPGPRSLDLGRRLRRVESRNVTHLSPDFPVFWEAARGANVRDADGNVYVDLTGAFGVALAGHGHPVIGERLQRQTEVLVHGMGDVHPAELKVALLERLEALVPWGESRGVLASSGSEGVEVALKTGLMATGRPGILAFRGGYHGLTLGALAATSRDDFREPFRARLFPSVDFAPFPRNEEELGPALGVVESCLSKGVGGVPVGTVILEPIQGRGGVRVPPDGFLAGVVERARAAGAVVVFDEIFTGMGRTGRVFAWEHEGIAPDVLVLGKALGGGLPLSACLGRADVMDAWPDSSGEALHTSTFLGHPLSCATALAYLDVMEEEDIPGLARAGEARVRNWARERFPEAGSGLELRGRGVMMGLERPGNEPSGLAGWGARVAVEALRRGVLVLPAGERGEVVEITPPATILSGQLDAALAVVAEAAETA